MATFTPNHTETTSEIHTYTVDFTNDLPTGGTVTGGTATHTPPSGNASTLTVSVASPYLYATLPAQTVMGLHYIDVLGYFNDGDKSAVRIPITIGYPTPTARTGMADLISELRALTDSGVDDYEVAGLPYWNDAQLQKILDNHRTDLKWVEMTAWEEGDGTWLDYQIGHSNLEQTSGGTAIFMVQDVNGAVVSASLYTVDYQRGLVTFSSDTNGATYWVTGRAFDLKGAAADVWRKKMVHYHTAVNFATDNHKIDREKLYQHAKEMAEHFESQGASGVESVQVWRSDTDQ